MRKKIFLLFFVSVLLAPIALSAQNSGGTWYVQEHINDFDGYTTYSFFVKGSGVSQNSAWLFVGYDKYMDKDDVRDDLGIFSAGLNGKFGDFSLGGVYMHGKADEVVNKNGFVISADYKGADFKKAGTWGLSAKYYDQGDGTFVSHVMNGTYPNEGGFRGYMVAGYVTVAKGMRAGIEYYDLKGKEEPKTKARTLWTELQVRF